MSRPSLLSNVLELLGVGPIRRFAIGAKLSYEVDPPKGSSRRKAAVAEISLWNPGGRT
jgi:hypothetical protein